VSRFSEIIKCVTGKSEQKAANIPRQTGKFRSNRQKTIQRKKDAIIQRCRHQSDDCIQHKIPEPGKSLADSPIKFLQIVPHHNKHIYLILQKITIQLL
jgi:hypothetical protein